MHTEVLLSKALRIWLKERSIGEELWKSKDPSKLITLDFEHEEGCRYSTWTVDPDSTNIVIFEYELGDPPHKWKKVYSGYWAGDGIREILLELFEIANRITLKSCKTHRSTLS